ncbi:MAG: RHS repeat-associated core domain-containing protein [Candidatus Thiodiazotropha endolucinida]
MQGRQKRSPFAFLSLALTLLWFICFSSLVHAYDQVNALWVAESTGVIKVATADGSVLLEIEDDGDPRAVSVDQANAKIWVYGNDTLRAYGFDGVLLSQTQVSSINSADESASCQEALASLLYLGGLIDSGLDCFEHIRSILGIWPINLVVSKNDGGVWLSVFKTLYQFDHTGTLQNSITFDRIIRSITHETATNQLWIAVANEVVTTTPDGSTSEIIELGEREYILDLAYDDNLDEIWVVTSSDLQRYTTNGEQSFVQSLRYLRQAAPDGHGGVWLAGQHRLYRMDASGLIHFEMGPFQGLGLRRLIDIVADQTDHTVWVANKYAIKHIDHDGQILHTFVMEGQWGIQRAKIRDLAIYTDAVAPELTILSPSDASYINSQQPQITLELVDDGSGVDVESLEILAEGEALPVECSGTLPEWVCTPTVALADGPVSLNVIVADNAGNRSEPVVSTFTIDTQIPEITLQSPIDGLLTNQPELTVSGSVSEAATVTLNGEALMLAIDHTFSETLTLIEGNNEISLQATDLAGNVTDLSALVVLDTLSPAAVDLALIQVSEVIDGEVTVTGDPSSVEPESKVTIKNQRTGETVTTTANADGSFILLITAEHSDELSILVSDQAGNDSDEAGTAVTDVVPGVGTIPPDPAQLAPPFSPSAPVTLFAASEFLYNGTPPVQTGVDPSTISKQRVAVVRGLVLDRNNRPLPGVKITIKNHSEFGQTLTRRDGMLDMAVNGGGLLTIDYEKAGYLPVQRKVDAPWQDYVWAEDVVMIRLDEQVSTIDLSNPTAPMQVAQGSTVTDEDGTRQATVLFPSGTTASMTMPDGSTQPLTTLNVRATEYTVGENGPEAMPAPLPPASGYTYAVELSADEAIAAGAKRVEFSQPLPFYVDNFLNFPVGVIVPVGYYDFDKTAWVPSDNGRVIQILRIENGRAVLDVMGNGQAATAEELSTLSVTDQELVGLAGLYEAGKTLWRASVNHFTPFDCNWPFGPPDDAEPPIPPPPPPPKDSGDDPEEPECEENSIIECQSQVLGEKLSITGTPYTLNYRSSRVPGRIVNDAITEITLTSSDVPQSLKEIRLYVSINGRLTKHTYTPEPNLTHSVEWDGKDAYGRSIVGVVPASIKIAYEYEPVYYGNRYETRTSINRVFGRWIDTYGQDSAREIGAARNETSMSLLRGWKSKVQPTVIGNSASSFVAQTLGTGGWSLEIQHNYDPTQKKLHLGTGKTVSAENIGFIINRVADLGGTTAQGALDEEGNFYVAEASTHSIYKITPGGLRSVIAGSGTSGFSGDGGIATEARLHDPTDVSIGPNGELYVVDQGNHRVRMIDTDGIISTVAGNGSRNYSGDEGPAIEASLNRPYSVAIASDGTFYISDTGNNRIRRVSVDGIISTYAGNGMSGYSGDGGTAVLATLSSPKGLALNDTQHLYIVDSLNHVIRKVSEQAVITTVSGSGQSGFDGDGGPAIAARHLYPEAVTVRDNGSFYVVDNGNRRIRYVDVAGNISTIAGSGIYGNTGDLGPARQATFEDPLDILLSDDHSFYVLDRGRIRAVGLTMEGYTGANYLVPSPDGEELYEFDDLGRHLRTISTITGADLYTFIYDNNGFVSQLTDGYGNVTRLERDTESNLTGIVSPDNYRTTIELDSNGYLTNFTNQNNESYQFVYTPGGLLTSITDPKGHIATMQYDGRGRLIRDENPAGGIYQILKTELTDGYRVELSTNTGLTTSYDVLLSYGQEIRETTQPDGTVHQKLIDTLGSWAREETLSPSGLRSVTDFTTNERFGWLARQQGLTRLEMPSGIVREISSSDSVILDDVTNPLSLISLNTYNQVNNRYSSVRYDAQSMRYIYTSPQDRYRVQITDSQGSLLSDQFADLATVYYDYDSRGRLTNLRMGSGSDERRLSAEYGQNGYVSTLTDPIGRIFAFSYDSVGRITEQTLPDGRVIGYQYDEKGNLAAIVPPGRSAHQFVYTPIDLEASYSSPVVGDETNVTRYHYNLNKQLESVERPDGTSIYMDYDSSGRLNMTRLSRGTIQYGYNAQTGLIESIIDPDGGILNFTYDGPLFLSETWSGEISGTVERQYDNNFWITGYSVNGNATSMTYDLDGLLTRSGDLTFARDSANGMITATQLSEVDSITTYNIFGEKDQERFASASIALDAVVEGQNITADILEIAGQIGGAGAVVINGQAMQVASDGVVTGSVPLPSINANNLNIEVFDTANQLTGQLQRTIIREPSQTDFNINGIVEMAPNGDIYFFNSTAAGQVLLRRLAGTSTASQYTWLVGATDVTVADSGEVFLLKGMNLSSYDGATETSVIDLAAAGLSAVSDIEMGVDGWVYIASERNIHRVENGNLYLIATLPNGNQPVVLEHSAWGLVANGGGGDFFYRIQTDGTLDTLRSSETWLSSDFALSDGGAVCWQDEGPVCSLINDPSAPWDWLNFNTDSMAFGADGALYYSDLNNIYRYENDISEPILSGGQAVSGILRLSGSLGENLYSVNYGMDKLGRITELAENVAGNETIYLYNYDLASRVESVTENSIEIERYRYDNNGNRTHVNDTLVATYDEQDRLLTYGNATFSYTANGELIQKTENGVTTHYAYDELGNLMQVRLPGGITIDYVIDGKNRRIGKKVNGELVQGFLYKDQINPIAEVGRDGRIISQFIYGSKINIPAYMIKDNVTYRVISDHLGSPRLIVNAQTGEISQRIAYDLWGKVILDTNPGFQPFGFAGGIYDYHAQLVRFGARDYDPEIARWLTKDPIGFDGDGVNLYAYSGNDPVNYLDLVGFGKLGTLKDALRRVHQEVGGSLPKGKPGKYGSPQRGDSKKGYRYDREGHPNSTDPNEKGPHINYWDYTKGKRGKGGKSGAIPLSGAGADIFGEGTTGADIVDFFNPMSDLQDLKDLISDWNSPDEVDRKTYDEFCRQNPTAPNCTDMNICP